MFRRFLQVAASIVFGFAPLVHAQHFPERPVRLVVPFPPGGSVDVVARALAPKLSERMGQQVVIENRSGASGIIGTESVARAKPDGYTLLINTIPFVTNTYLYSKVPYDPFADFLPVAWLCSSPATLVVNPSVPARSVRELLALAKSKPGALNYSAAGAGTNPHFAGELFNSLGQVDIVAVQYKGGGPSLLAALGGEVGITFPNISEAIPHVKTGKLVVLGVTGAKRSLALPDVPTIAESGLPGYEFVTWHGVLAPRGTPPAVVSLLNAKLKETLALPEQARLLEQMGFEIVASSPEEFAAHLRRESEKWGKVIKERHIRVE
ncbi:MAG TPA: tripartite tricarboxylate transporter substrate binding protein [Burkholderiales bacterium]|nr:tripartite tricarboxylate transporter substrate binding protein [Burkholderiales bacterium]